MKFLKSILEKIADFLIRLLGGHKMTVVYVRQTFGSTMVKNAKTYPLGLFTTIVFIDRGLSLVIKPNRSVELKESKK